MTNGAVEPQVNPTSPVGPLKTGTMAVDNAGNVWALTKTGPVFVITLAGITPVGAAEPQQPQPSMGTDPQEAFPHGDHRDAD
jgi:hypothetical protein